MTERWVNEIRRKNPKLALKADYGRSAISAIKLFCLECVGDSLKDVKECTVVACPLWQYRPGAGKDFSCREGIIPAQAELEKLASDRVTDAQRAAGDRLAKRNRKSD